MPGFDTAVWQACFGEAPHGGRAQVGRADEALVALVEALDQGGLDLGALALSNGLFMPPRP
ncbi:MAG: hypothetical protein U1E30_04750 [Rhodoblastus sp.]